MANLRANNVCGTDGRNAITGSVEFDGTGDYLQTTSSDYALGTSDFTVEYWVNYSTKPVPGTPVILDDESPTYAPLIGYPSGTPGNAVLYMSSSGSSWDIASGTVFGPITGNSWVHLALTRKGSTFYLFYNGVLANTISSSASVYQSANTITAGYAQANTYFQGFISNLRAIKGTALYTSNFIPPTRKLIRVPGTVLLCCQDNTSVTTEATGKTITANGNPAARRFVPQVGSDGGLVFDGTTKVNTQNYFYLPTGITEQRSRGRGVFGGGVPNINTIDYVNIQSIGNAIDFGDLTVARYSLASCSSTNRGLFAGGGFPGTSNTIDYITISTTSNASDFGDLTAAIAFGISSCSSNTRGIFGGGATPTILNTISYVTIASTGNAVSFGSLSQTTTWASSCSSNTRGIFGGGTTPTILNTIDYITIASTGNAVSFGQLTQTRRSLSACSSSTRGVFAGGYTPSVVNTIDYITIASTGNAVNFGSLTGARSELTACSSSIRGLFGGGVIGTSQNTIDYITIASTGNAQDFGDLTVARYGPAACSDSHGGLG